MMDPKLSVHISGAGLHTGPVRFEEQTRRLCALSRQQGFDASCLHRPGRDDAIAAIASAVTRVSGNDGGVLIVSFSGHGAAKEGEEVAKHSDDRCKVVTTQSEQWVINDKETLPDWTLREQLRNASASAWVLVISDCCRGIGVPPAPLGDALSAEGPRFVPASLLTRLKSALGFLSIKASMLVCAPGPEAEGSDHIGYTDVFVDALVSMPLTYSELFTDIEAVWTQRTRSRPCVRQSGEHVAAMLGAKPLGGP